MQAQGDRYYVEEVKTTELNLNRERQRMDQFL